MQEPFFQGLKVVELASVLAGPAVGLFFAELGAKVTKIENAATGGDVTRSWKAPTEVAGKSDSAYYQSVNFGKETLLVDLKAPEGREQVEALIREADIVIVNYRPGAAEKLGMDYERLKAMNPRIIYAELTGFGADDPRLAFDVVLQAESGFLYLTGEPGRPPVKMPVALIDILAAHQLKEGILVALLKRAQTGKGSKVSTSLYAAALASLANQATNWLIAGFAPQRLGTQHPNIAPYGDLFRTADKQELVLAVGVETHWKKLCEVLAIAPLAEEERFATNAQRVKHRSALIPLLQERIGTFTNREELLALFQQNNIPAGAVRDLPDVFAQPLAQTLLINTFDESGQAIQCVKSVVFELSE